MATATEAESAPKRNDAYDDLRELLVRFEEMGEVERVTGAERDLEIGALSETVAAGNPGRAPALLFDDIPGFEPGFRVLSGAANGLRRLALVLGLPDPANETELVQSYRDRMHAGTKPIPPVELRTGPVLENVDRDGDVDLTKFPVPKVHELDGGRYIGTDDLVIMRDPDNGWVNAATYRVMMHDRNTVAIWMSPGKHGRRISEKYFAKGEPCPVAISCGQDPILFLAAHQEIDWELSEYAYAGGQRGRPIEIVNSELHGLPIPAHAELVLEGEIIPGETRLEGPFGEFMGYYASEATELPIVRIRRVYWRNDPILTLAIPSRPPENFTFARACVKSAMIWDEVEKAGLPGVAGVWCHEFRRRAPVQRDLDQAALSRPRDPGRHAGRQLPRRQLCGPLGGGGGRRYRPVEYVRCGLGNVDALRPAGGHPVHPPRLVHAAGPYGARGALAQQPRHRRCLPALRLEGQVPDSGRGEPGAQGARSRQVASPVSVENVSVAERPVRPSRERRASPHRAAAARQR